jgi:hypothetical protein
VDKYVRVRVGPLELELIEMKQSSDALIQNYDRGKEAQSMVFPRRALEEAPILRIGDHLGLVSIKESASAGHMSLASVNDAF